MAEYVVTGKKGSGKNLYACHIIDRYIRQGRKVATNMDLFFENFYSSKSDDYYYRIPDVPTIDVLENLPYIDNNSDESKNGALIFDECGSWLNTRDFSNKDRKAVLNWLIHSRKKGWDVYYIVQHIDMIDKQIRDGFAEHLVILRRLDRLPIPILGSITALIGASLRFPQYHVATIHYGSSVLDPVVSRDVFKGTEYFNFYDTKQVINPFTEHVNVSCSLPSSHFNRNNTKFDDFKINFRRFLPLLKLTLLFLAFLTALWYFLIKDKSTAVEEVEEIDYPVSAVIYDSFTKRGYQLKNQNSSQIEILSKLNNATLEIQDNDEKNFFNYR